MPLGEVGCAVLIAQIAVLCVRHEPVLLFVKPLLERLAAQGGAAFLLKEQLEVFLLGVYHAFVVDALQLVELFAQ